MTDKLIIACLSKHWKVDRRSCKQTSHAGLQFSQLYAQLLRGYRQQMPNEPCRTLSAESIGKHSVSSTLEKDRISKVYRNFYVEIFFKNNVNTLDKFRHPS